MHSNSKRSTTVDPALRGTELYPWDTGHDVVELQRILNAHGYKLRLDGDFGRVTEAAVMAFQQQHGLVMDGVVSAKTWVLLKHTLQPGSRMVHRGDTGEDVRKLQSMLQIWNYDLASDGIFGAKTEEIIIHFQERHHLKVTGEVDAVTWTLIWGSAPLPNPPKQTGWFFDGRRWW